MDRIITKIFPITLKKIQNIFRPTEKSEDQLRFDAFLIENEKSSLRREAYIRFTFVAIVLFTEFIGIIFNLTGQYDEGGGFPEVGFDIIFKLGFAPTGLIQLWLAKKDINYKPWMKYCFMCFDVIWFGLYQIMPNPFLFPIGTIEFTQEALKNYNHQSLRWLFLVYAWAALYFSANLVRALGLYICAFWATTYQFLANLPGTVEKITTAAILGHPSQSEYTRISGFVDIGIAIDNMAMAIFLTIGFTIVAKYHYKIATNFFATEERKRALSRFFSPNLIEQLGKNGAAKEVVNVNAAIAFTDMINFTDYASTRPPEEVLEVLQEFHSIIESEVFRYDGTLEKYIGDAAMAVFGAPVQSNNDADNAVKCAIDWIFQIDNWNKTRALSGKQIIEIGIGIDFGPVTAGVIGQNRNMSYAVVGTTVNRASRLENLTRTQNAQMIISDELYQHLQDKNIFKSRGFQINQTEVSVRNFDTQSVWVVTKL